MNILSYLHFLTFFVQLFLAGYILVKDPKALLNRILSVLLFLFSAWSFMLIFLQSVDTTEALATTIIKIIGPTWYLYPYLFVWFILAFIKADRILRSKIFYLFVFIPPAILSYLQARGSLLVLIKESYGWSYTAASPVFLNTVLIYQVALLIASITVMLVFSRRMKDLVKKRQANIIFVSALLAILVGYWNVFASLSDTNIPDISNLAIFIFSTGLVYAIARYRLFIITPAMAADEIIKIMPDLLFLVDKSWNIAGVNKAFVDVTGYTEKDLAGLPISNFIKGDTKAILGELGKNRIIKDKRAIFIAKDGQEIVTVLSGSMAVNKETGLEYAVMIAKDIRDLLEIIRREAEEKEKRLSAEKYAGELEIRVKERTVELSKKMVELEKLNKVLVGMELKNEFIQILNHQIRTPVTVLRWSLDLWKTDKYDKYTLEKKNAIKSDIIGAVDHLSALVNNMLDAIEVEGSEPKLNIEEIDARHFVEEIYAVNFKRGFEEKGVAFNVFSPQKLPIRSDRKYLEIVIANLLDNSMKYTSHGKVEVKLALEDDNVIFSITDSGIGLSEKDKAGLFQKFVRGEAVSKILPGGSGLGLYIAKKAAGYIRGEITAESEGRNKGTTFVLKLPAFLT